ncbi:MAG: GGDEF domain-containing protein [Nitriliruptor sp.]|nr:MAG: GGDEF domain-containing protein [Nitriliruptor sp.]
MEPLVSREPPATTWRVPVSPGPLVAVLMGLTVILHALLTGDGPGRTGLFGVGAALTVVAAVVVLLKPDQRSSTPPIPGRAAPSRSLWGPILALTAATAVWLDGGALSPLVLLFPLVAVFGVVATSPLVAGSTTVGVLVAYGTVAILGGAPWTVTITGLLLLAAVAGVARFGSLRHLGARQQLAVITAAPQPLEHTDVLTGTLNHQGLHERLSAVIDAAGPNEPLAALVIDLDGFKRFNHSFGHLVGDEVLRSVVAALRDICRPDDLVSRPTGDVFVVVLTGVPFAVAHGAAERVHDRLAAAGLAVTVSIGVGWTAGPIPPGELLERAEEALGAAKAAGRACTRLIDAGKTDVPAAPIGSGGWQVRDDVVDAGGVGLEISLIDRREHADP